MLSSPLVAGELSAAPVDGMRQAAAAIELKHLWKRYRRYLYRNLSLKGRALDWLHKRASQFVEFEALRDVTFTIQRGESVALLGRNGAGKSTLLKIIAGVVGPDSGIVNVSGHVSPLLELGAGFAPELSGRRNTYLYGALLGLSRRQIDARLESIVDFSEIGDFLDTPVKHYSTGMYLRLAFSIAAHLDPDILLIDEVLSVGDAGFQAKCLERISEFRETGKTLIIVTHVPEQAIEFCDRAILIDHGSVIADGTPDHVVVEYTKLVGAAFVAVSGAEGEFPR